MWEAQSSVGPAVAGQYDLVAKTGETERESAPCELGLPRDSGICIE